MHESAASALKHYALTDAKLTPLTGGLINTSFRVDAHQGSFVLQALHPIFRAELHYDIEAITKHLQDKGMPTPRLVPTQAGALFIEEDARVWRLQTYLPSTTHDRVTSPRLAAAAGTLVGRFHMALADLKHTFHFARKGVHDTAAHVQTLLDALREHPKHRFYDIIAPVADAITSAQLKPIDLAHQRIAHGDLKISNLLFDARGEGLCLIDLDTMGMMPLAHEMGDAWRSWCNPLGEDEVEAHFNLDLFEASARAYLGAVREMITPEERALLVTGVATISLELAARFCADALRESYFGWNPNKFPDRSTHNWVRARSQLHLHQSIMKQAVAAERIIATC